MWVPRDQTQPESFSRESHGNKAWKLCRPANIPRVFACLSDKVYILVFKANEKAARKYYPISTRSYSLFYFYYVSWEEEG